jgi:uncharacterized protein
MTSTSESGLPTTAPLVSPESARFWAGTAESKLMLPRCVECSTIIWYPKGICPECHSTNIEWFEASGRGEIYSFSYSRRGEGPYRDVVPFVIAYVELEEGPRMMTNIVGCEINDVQIGKQVVAVFEDTREGNALVRFRLSDS